MNTCKHKRVLVANSKNIREEFKKSGWDNDEYFKQEIDSVCKHIDNGENLAKYWSNYLDTEERGGDVGYDTHYIICESARSQIRNYLLEKYNMECGEVDIIIETLIRATECEDAYGYASDMMISDLETKDAQKIVSICQEVANVNRHLDYTKKYLNELLSGEYK